MSSQKFRINDLLADLRDAAAAQHELAQSGNELFQAAAGRFNHVAKYRDVEWEDELEPFIEEQMTDPAWRAAYEAAENEDSDSSEPIYNNFMEAFDARIFAMLVPDDAPEVAMTSTFVTVNPDGTITAWAYGDTAGERVWAYSRVYKASSDDENDAVMNLLYDLNAEQPTSEHLPGFKNRRGGTHE